MADQRKSLSELEGAVLGILVRKQPVSAYAVREEFRVSPTESWTASAGSIYPLVRRLQERGLIAPTKVEGDGRNTRLLSLTEAGEAAVEDWLMGDREGIFGPVSDPLRTRGFAITALPETTRCALLSRWQERTAERIAQLRADMGTSDEHDETGWMAARGTILQLEARLQWLEEWLHRLGGGATPKD